MRLNSKLVIIKPDTVAEQDDSGVYIAEEWKDLPPTGVVEVVADDVTFCKPGDKVYFTRYAADETPWGTLICREDHIRAVI